MNPSNIFPMEKLRTILDEIKVKGNLLGALIATRDGNVISNNFNKNFDINEFSAMIASVVESAEDLKNTVDEKKVKRIIVELNDYTMVILGCDKKAILVLFIGEEADEKQLFKDLKSYIKEIVLKFQN